MVFFPVILLVTTETRIYFSSTHSLFDFRAGLAWMCVAVDIQDFPSSWTTDQTPC